MNKRGVLPLVLILSIAGVLVFAYIVLNISPQFAVVKIKNIVNFVGIVLIFASLQVLFIYGYYRLGKYIVTSIDIYRNKLLKLSINIQKYVLFHK